MFFSTCFFLTCIFWLQLCKMQIWRRDDRALWSDPGSLARNQHMVDQQDSVDSAGQLGPAACNLDAQLCRHRPATVLIEFWITGCVIMAYLVELLEWKLEITKKITKNFQLPKKSWNITKSNYKITNSVADMCMDVLHSSIFLWVEQHAKVGPSWNWFF